jgi:hypothetical protein
MATSFGVAWQLWEMAKSLHKEEPITALLDGFRRAPVESQ